MKNLILPALAALSLFTACEEKPAPASAPSAAPAAAEPAAAAPAAEPAAQAVVAGAAIPVPKVTISTSAADIAKGKEVFAAKGCPACHKVGGGKLVGPDLKGVLARREQEWVEKMILRPDVMVKEDETAKKLLAEHLVPMPNQGVDAEKDLPFILSYLASEK